MTERIDVHPQIDDVALYETFEQYSELGEWCNYVRHLREYYIWEILEHRTPDIKLLLNDYENFKLASDGSYREDHRYANTSEAKLGRACAGVVIAFHEELTTAVGRIEELPEETPWKSQMVMEMESTVEACLSCDVSWSELNPIRNRIEEITALDDCLRPFLELLAKLHSLILGERKALRPQFIEVRKRLRTIALMFKSDPKDDYYNKLDTAECWDPVWSLRLMLRDVLILKPFFSPEWQRNVLLSEEDVERIKSWTQLDFALTTTLNLIDERGLENTFGEGAYAVAGLPLLASKVCHLIDSLPKLLFPDTSGLSRRVEKGCAIFKDCFLQEDWTSEAPDMSVLQKGFENFFVIIKDLYDFFQEDAKFITSRVAEIEGPQPTSGTIIGAKGTSTQIHSRHGGLCEACVICQSDWIDLNPEVVLSTVRKMRRALQELQREIHEHENDTTAVIPSAVAKAIEHLDYTTDLVIPFKGWLSRPANRVSEEIPPCLHVIIDFTKWVDEVVENYNCGDDIMRSAVKIADRCGHFDKLFKKEMEECDELKTAARRWDKSYDSIFIPTRSIVQYVTHVFDIPIRRQQSNNFTDLSADEYLDAVNNGNKQQGAQDMLPALKLLGDTHRALAERLGSSESAKVTAATSISAVPEQPKLEDKSQQDWIHKVTLSHCQSLFGKPGKPCVRNTVINYANPKHPKKKACLEREERGCYKVDPSHPDVIHSPFFKEFMGIYRPTQSSQQQQ